MSTRPANGALLEAWYASTQKKGGYVVRTSQSPNPASPQWRVRHRAHQPQLLQRGTVKTTPTSRKTGEYGARAGGPYRSKAPTAAGDPQMNPSRLRAIAFSSPRLRGDHEVQPSHSEYPYHQSTSHSPLSSSPSFSRGRRPGIDAGPTPVNDF